MSLASLIEPLEIKSSLFYPDAQIVFVCGRDLNDSRSKRKVFLQYAKKNLHNFQFLLAEDVFETKMHEEEIDLLTIESAMSDYADCIIIILESESAFAELGAFAFSDKLSKKIIIINDKSFQNSTSFIINGPTKKVEQQKDGFGKSIYVSNMESFLSCVSTVELKLSKIKKQKAFRKKLDTYELLKENNKERMLLMYDIIGFLSPVSLKELITICVDLYGKNDFSFLRTDISILKSLKMLHTKQLFVDGESFDYLTVNGHFPRFIKTDIKDRINVRSDVLLHYKNKFTNRLDLL